jgi:hypothetical protein
MLAPGSMTREEFVAFRDRASPSFLVFFGHKLVEFVFVGLLREFEYIDESESSWEHGNPEYVRLSEVKGQNSRWDKCKPFPRRPSSLFDASQKHSVHPKDNKSGDYVCVVEAREEEQRREETDVEGRVDII